MDNKCLWQNIDYICLKLTQKDTIISAPHWVMTEWSVLIVTLMVSGFSAFSPCWWAVSYWACHAIQDHHKLFWDHDHLIQVCLCFAPSWKLLMHLSSLASFPTVWINGWYCPSPETDLKVYNNSRPISHFLQNLLSRLLPVGFRLVCLVKKKKKKKKYERRFNLGSGEKK